MITLILALTVAFGCFALSHFAADIGLGWSIFFGILGFGAFQATFGVLIQRRMKRDMELVQKILTDGQKRLQQKMQGWQHRPHGSLNEMQRILAEDTKVFVKEAIAQTEKLARYRPWVLMISRQIATAKVQLSWMIKDFKTVDMLMPKVLLFDPTMIAIKMARLYMTGGDMAEIAKLYAKGVRRVRYNGNVLLAAEMSWMQVKKGDVDGAFKTLTEALTKSDNATLRQNHEHLMNNRVAHFNNSGIGDQWYSLQLEEPRIKTPRQRPVYR